MEFDETKIEFWRWEGRRLEPNEKAKCWDQDNSSRDARTHLIMVTGGY